ERHDMPKATGRSETPGPRPGVSSVKQMDQVPVFHVGTRPGVSSVKQMDQVPVFSRRYAARMTAGPILHGERVLLRPLEERDFERLVEIGAEPEVARWWPGVTH